MSFNISKVFGSKGGAIEILTLIRGQNEQKIEQMYVPIGNPD